MKEIIRTRQGAITLIASLSITLIGCGEIKAPPTTESSPNLTSESTVTQKQTNSVSNSVSVSKNQQITPEGIGVAKLGMTFGELKKALPENTEFKVESPLIVDWDAIAVSQDGDVLYYILYPAGETFEDSDTIETLLTDNPNYRTAQGIGPETPIAKAEEMYGDATLSFNWSNEAREYVKFDKLSEDIKFRTQQMPGDDQFAGVYKSPETEEVNQTDKFKEAASIGSVEVYLNLGEKEE